MKITNTSNYPVTVNGVRIESGEVEEVEIEKVEKYRNDRRFLLEEDDESQPDGDDESDDTVEETSKPEKQNKNKGD